MTGCPFEGPQKTEPGQETGYGHSSVTYNSYLKVEELKELQICLSNPAHHDEPLFIIIHQTYELWFKLILHELDAVVEQLKTGNVRRANFYTKRCVAIFKILSQQIFILETMAPKDFLGFRYNLTPASGFQSSQFREIEFMGGLKSDQLLEHFKEDKEAYARLQRRYSEPSLGDLFYDVLEKRGFKMPRATGKVDEDEKSRKTRIGELVSMYNQEDKYGELIDLAETLMDFDELISLWRTNHVTVVERMIGFKQGTGGSEGVGYLRSTLGKRMFNDLWQLRTYLEAPE